MIIRTQTHIIVSLSIFDYSPETLINEGDKQQKSLDVSHEKKIRGNLCYSV